MAEKIRKLAGVEAEARDAARIQAAVTKNPHLKRWLREVAAYHQERVEAYRAAAERPLEPLPVDPPFPPIPRALFDAFPSPGRNRLDPNLIPEPKVTPDLPRNFV